MLELWTFGWSLKAISKQDEPSCKRVFLAAAQDEEVGKVSALVMTNPIYWNDLTKF